ncbi:MAG: MrcB family domain-containing protein [Candidatus Malihini olakiniferum]
MKSPNAIFQLIPDEFTISLAGRLDEFTIRPSIGKEIVKDIPWVCILHKTVTSIPQSGYCIALLFSYDM